MQIMVSRVSTWIRPLEEEGVETHPGPRFVSKNVDGLKSPGRFKNFLDHAVHAHERDPVHAFFIQEHNLHPSDYAHCRSQAARRGMLWIASHKPANSTQQRGTGTGILIPIDMITLAPGETVTAATTRVTNTHARDREGRLCSVRCTIRGVKLRLTCCYAPADSTKRQAFFTKKLAPFVTRNTLLAIDANCVPDPSLDRRSNAATPADDTGSDDLAALVISKGLIDVAREQLGTERIYTAHHNTANGVTDSRIDQMYAPRIDALEWTHELSHDFMPKVDGMLDHVALQLHLKTPSHKKGQDVKYINERVFEDPETNGAVADIIRRHIPPGPLHDFPAPLATLQALKTEVIAYAFEATQRMQKRDTERTKLVKKQIAICRNSISSGSATAQTHTQLHDLRTELASLTPTQRTLADTVEEQAWQRGAKHDTGSAAMYRTITPRSADQWINAIAQADWSDPSNPEWLPRDEHPPVTVAGKIAGALRKYYKALFSRKTPEPAAKTKARAALKRGRQVLPPTAARCGEPMTADEIRCVSLSLPTGKAPGPDRLPNAFYKNFADKLCHLLAAAFNEAHTEGQLPDQMREGLISILYKKKARDDPRNYRPITLLNSDYKIMMRVLTQRMNEAIVQIVSDAQNGFTPNSFIAENTMLVQLLQAYVEVDPDDDEGAMMLFLDMEKAFDRCSWEFLHDALQDLGFPDTDGDMHPFRRWVNLAYNHGAPPTRRIHANGYLSEPFALASGVAQGCPLSPLLFICFTEVLSRMMEEATHAPSETGHPALRGISVRNILHILSQFADDTILFLRLGDIDHAEAILKIYCAATGLAENFTKREIALIGRLKRRRERVPQNLHPFLVKDGDWIRTLGIPFGTFEINSIGGGPATLSSRAEWRAYAASTSDPSRDAT